MRPSSDSLAAALLIMCHKAKVPQLQCVVLAVALDKLTRSTSFSISFGGKILLSRAAHGQGIFNLKIFSVGKEKQED